MLTWVGDLGLTRRRPREPLANPFGERGDFLGHEFLLVARHRFDVLSLRVVNSENEATLLGLAKDNDGTDFPAFENVSPGV